MAIASSSSTEILDPKSEMPDSLSENPNPNPNPDITPLPPENPNPDPPNPSPNPPIVIPPPLFTPSFRPLGVPPTRQHSTLTNPNPSPGIQPPGVSALVMYGSVTVSAPPIRYPPPNAPPMGYGQFPNGYLGVPPPGCLCNYLCKSNC